MILLLGEGGIYFFLSGGKYDILSPGEKIIFKSSSTEKYTPQRPEYILIWREFNSLFDYFFGLFFQVYMKHIAIEFFKVTFKREVKIYVKEN